MESLPPTPEKFLTDQVWFAKPFGVKRILTAMPLVVAAILVAGVLVSSSVQAEEGGPALDIGAAPAVLTANSPVGKAHSFTFRDKFGGVFVVFCGFANFEGKTAAKSVTEITVTPVFFECQQGGAFATVTMNGCKYRLKWTAALKATVDIIGCTSGKAIEITFGACQILIPAQNGLSHVTFQNVAGAPPDVNDKFTLSKVVNQQIGGLACPGGNSTKADGEIEGTTTIRAWEYKEEIQAEVKGHQFQQYVDLSTPFELKST
jgi:hypothetical protein